MDNTILEAAFVRGMCKRAEEVGMSKEAFLPLALRIASPFLGQFGAAKALRALGASKSKFIPKFLGTAARATENAMLSPLSAKGIAANMGVFGVGDAVASRITEPLAAGLERNQQSE
jgi:hypothetical protein